VKIVVLAYPRIANFDDFDPLRLEPASISSSCGRRADPGDARWSSCRLEGHHRRPRRPARGRLGHRPAGARAARRPVLGICGGYQMLGRSVADPHGIEGRRRR
jgi:adenosylcobyric acid synthase